MLKIALVVSHPIQHFCPQYVSFASHPAIRLKVFFASALGYKKYMDPNFKSEVSWGNLNLDKFDHIFLNGDKLIPSDRNLDADSLDDELMKFAPGLIIIYGYFQRLQRRAHQWAKRNNVQLAYISDSELRHKRSWIREVIKYFFIRNYFAKINYFLSVGDENEEFYKKYGVTSQNIIRMHFPIDVDQYRRAFENRYSLRRQVRARHEIDSGKTVLIVVGKLVPWKSQDHLIETLARLEQQNFLVDLFIVGSGLMETEWKEKARDLKVNKVHFTGFININELPAYYAASDIYVHPASMEPHSIAISEAIYMGLPVVLSDRCGSYGPSDDVQESRNGFTYPFGDIDSLAEKIKAIASDPSLCQRLGEHSHRIAVEFQQQSHGGVVDDLVKRSRA